MSYKRLTKKGNYYDKDDHELGLVIELDERHYEEVNDIDTICEKLNRLAELEDKIENGTLIELPCKVGDTGYCIYRDDDYEYWIEAEEVVDFIINDCDIDIGTACRMIGKVYREEIFLIKAEAEAKLLEIKGVTK